MLHVLEGVIFCCLMALVIFWFADRLRSIDFDPILVTPCVGEACAPYDGPPAGRPWERFTQALEPNGLTTFSGSNMCMRLATLVQTQGSTAQGLDLIIDLMVSRGTLMVTQADVAGQSVFSIIPGPRNDGFFDGVRDAIVMGPSRGCHSMNYKPVFWPLFFAWTALASLRALRVRQAVWATR